MADYDDMQYDHVYADAMEDAAAQAEAELIAEAMREASADNVRDYLCPHGDVVEDRVQTLLGRAQDLANHGFYGPATTVAVTASELIIRFLLLRPLVQGAFLDDIWAAILTDRVVRGRSADARGLLPRVLKGWDVELTEIRLSTGAMMWNRLLDVWKQRNDFVHLGKPVEEEAAQLAVECAEALLGVARQIGLRFGCGPRATGSWREVRSGSGFLSHTYSYEPKDPFE